VGGRQSDDAAHQARPLVEHLSGGTWTAQQPAGMGTGFSDINGVTVSHNTVWLVGSAHDAASGLQLTVVARNSGSGWQRVPAPNPGTGDKVLGGISAAAMRRSTPVIDVELPTSGGRRFHFDLEKRSWPTVRDGRKPDKGHQRVSAAPASRGRPAARPCATRRPGEQRH
jgi:hypothetical protein